MPNNRTGKRSERLDSHSEPRTKQARQMTPSGFTQSSVQLIIFAKLWGLKYNPEQDGSSIFHDLVAWDVEGSPRNDFLHSFLQIAEALKDINTFNSNGETAFGMACRLGCKEVVEILLAQPLCDVNVSTEASPLQVAVECNQSEIVKILLANERVNVLGVWSKCLEAAVAFASADIIDLLKQWREQLPEDKKSAPEVYGLPPIDAEHQIGHDNTLSHFQGTFFHPGSSYAHSFEEAGDQMTSNPLLSFGGKQYSD